MKLVHDPNFTTLFYILKTTIINPLSNLHRRNTKEFGSLSYDFGDRDPNNSPSSFFILKLRKL
jgi:hypothetical protein